VATVANAIASGEIKMGIAGGVETMTNGDMRDMQNTKGMAKSVFENDNAAACLISMGITSENVAKKYGVDRAM